MYLKFFLFYKQSRQEGTDDARGVKKWRIRTVRLERFFEAEEVGIRRTVEIQTVECESGVAVNSNLFEEG